MLEERGWTQVELAHRMSRPIKTINEIVKGKASITPETALQLERTLGVSAGFWLNNERRYREHLARGQEESTFGQHAAWLKELPVKKMIDLGWIPAPEQEWRHRAHELNAAVSVSEEDGAKLHPGAPGYFCLRQE